MVDTMRSVLVPRTPGVLVASTAAAVFVIGCSQEPDEVPPMTFAEACDSVPGCATPTLSVEGPTAPIWRVLVSRDDAGAVRIDRFEEIETPDADGRPLGPSDGSHALVALDGAGAVLESRLVLFPETLVAEAYPFGDEVTETPIVGPTNLVAFLAAREDVETIALVEPDGTMVHSVAAPALGEAVRSEELTFNALTQPAPNTHCAHVMLLEGPEDEAWLPPWADPLQEVTPLRRAVIRSALGRMTADHCAGLSRVAFVAIDNFGVGGRTILWAGDMAFINGAVDIDGLGFDDRSLVTPRAQALLQRALIHEVGHNSAHLLESAGGRWWYDSEWAPSQWRTGDEIVDRVRLRGGFLARWQAMHDSFVAQGWAEPYYGDNIERGQAARDADTNGVVALGAMSSYSAHTVGDDICEFAMWPTMRSVYEDYGLPVGPRDLRNDHACLAMSAHGENSVPASLSAVYTKLTFIRDLGWITDEAYGACTGEHTGLPREREGIEVWQDGELQRVFWEAPMAGIGTRDGRYLFTMSANGRAAFDDAEYDATFSMELDLGPDADADGPVPVDDISWPRGVYELNLLSPHVFRLRIPDAPAGNFDVTSGFVLVAEATNDQIVGSVFVREALRAQAPIPVPQVFDPPLQLRFLLSNR
jgi:hypothetical protein